MLSIVEFIAFFINSKFKISGFHLNSSVYYCLPLLFLDIILSPKHDPDNSVSRSQRCRRVVAVSNPPLKSPQCCLWFDCYHSSLSFL
jgi:hypothetical protein